MDDNLLARFVLGIVRNVLKYALRGAVIIGLIGLTVALVTGLLDDSMGFAASRLLDIVVNYAILGALGGAVVGMIYGLVTQKL